MSGRLPALVLLGAVLAACGEAPAPSAAPAPRPLDPAAIGHYCQMIVAYHPGPKAQIFLSDRSDPVWFSSVRDGIAFTRLPEEPKNIVAFYVNDMSNTEWEQPSDQTWIPADRAWYVLGSSRSGGMGAPEAVPFISASAAEAFAASFGGRVVRFDAIPADYILGEIATPPATGRAHDTTSGGHASEHAVEPAHQR